MSLLFSRVAAAGGLTLLLAACGGGGDAPADQPADAASEAVPTAEAGPDAVLALGKTKYEQVCITCHMADGNGTPGVFPPLVGSEWVNTAEANVPISIVLHGLQGPISVKGATYEAVMQPWGMIPDADIAAILTYVRSSWGNKASAVTPEQVKAIRDGEGARGAWTADELKAKYPAM
jgi:mono/diheme cytochrome c family protein